MLIYLVIIVITFLLCVLLNLLFGLESFPRILLIFAVDVLGAFIIDAIIAFVVRRLPNKWFNHKFKIFKIFKFEKKLYTFLGIKKWKDHIPELGQLTNFKKNKIQDPRSIEYLDRYLMEACYGETIHFVSIIFGFAVIGIDFAFNANPLTFGVLVGIANSIISFLSFAILRFNRPKLEILKARNERKKMITKQEESLEK